MDWPCVIRMDNNRTQIIVRYRLNTGKRYRGRQNYDSGMFYQILLKRSVLTRGRTPDGHKTEWRKFTDDIAQN